MQLPQIESLQNFEKQVDTINNGQCCQTQVEGIFHHRTSQYETGHSICQNAPNSQTRFENAVHPKITKLNQFIFIVSVIWTHFIQKCLILECCHIRQHCGDQCFLLQLQMPNERPHFMFYYNVVRPAPSHKRKGRFCLPNA